MTKNQRLYNELRKFINKDRVQEYDNEFFAKKSHTYKSMLNLIKKYMNINVRRDEITDPKAYLYLAELENKFKTDNNKAFRESNKAKDIPRHIDKTYLFRDKDGNPDIPRYKE